MPPNALICTVLTTDWCCYWPDYITLLTNLHHTSTKVGPSTYQPVDPCTARLWSYTHLIHNPSLSPGMLTSYKAMLIHPAPLDTHIFITYHLYEGSHFGLYFILHSCHLLTQGCTKVINQTQALC